MWIDVPCGEKTNRVLLKDVLYAPDMGVTLVSVGRITAAGSVVVFRDNSCRIFNAAKELVGDIKASGGLYRVYHPKDYAARVTEVLSLYELHRRLGHISYDMTRELVTKGLVLGVQLDDSEPPKTCESCEHAKMTRKPIRREHEGGRAANVGDEIHSDLWGPAPVAHQGPSGGGLSHALSVLRDPKEGEDQSASHGLRGRVPRTIRPSTTA